MNDELKPEEREMLNAYVDGELSATERRSVESQLEQRAELRAAVAELEALRDLFQKLPSQSLPGQFVDRVMGSAERKMLLGEPAISTGSSQGKPWNFFRRRKWVVTALAASVLALLLVPTWYRKTTPLARAPSIPQSRESVKERPRDRDRGRPELTDGDFAYRNETPATAPEPALANRRAGEAIVAKSSAEFAEGAAVNQPKPSAGVVVGGREGKLIAELDSASDAPLREGGEERTIRLEAPVLAPRADQSMDGLILAHDEPVAANEVLIEVQLAASSAGQPELSLHGSEQATAAADGSLAATMDEFKDQTGAKQETDQRAPDQGGATGKDSLSRRLASLRGKNQEQIVAVETSLRQAGEILADLEQSGALLRDYPLSPEFSRQLAEQFRANQAIALEGQANTSRGISEVQGSVQLQVEQIVRARALGVDAQTQPQTDVVIVSPNLSDELGRTREQISADRPGEMQLTNRDLSTNFENARRQRGQVKSRREGSDARAPSDLKETEIQDDRQIRLYLWVREMPSGATKAAPQP